MDLLTVTTLCSLIVTPNCPHATAQSHSRMGPWQPMIARAAHEFDLPDAWVAAVMAQESAGRTSLHGSPIRSSAGAMGLMQVMPKTYQDLQRQYGLGPDADAPADNIRAGTAYLRQMYVRYGYPHMFAAYNAGPGRLDAFLAGHKPLPDETLRYLAAVAPGSETAFASSTVGAEPASKPGAQSDIFVGAASSGALFVPLSSGHF